jgi:succinate dehydrogenase / fumarate reductase cytochrome b subunit
LERAVKVLQSLSTSVGTKIVIGLTGLVLVGFLVFHLAGNLLLFFGAAKFNAHAHALISNPLVVPAELGLVAIFLLHIYKAVANYGRNLVARPQRYQVKKWAGGASRKSLGSATMIVSGVVTLAFVVLHLATFKYGPYYASPVPEERDLYRLTIEVFRQRGYVIFYVVTLTILGLHLRHGISSAFQSLGLIPDAWTRRALKTGVVLTLVITVGFIVIPLYVYFFL